jgi:tetratricopeptide (TPR) repeat protein
MVLVVALAFLCGCGASSRTQGAKPGANAAAGKKPAPGVRKNTQAQVSPAKLSSAPMDAAGDKLARAHAHYGAGVIHDMNEEPDQALSEYCQAAASDPSNETLMLEVTRRLLQQKQLEKAIELLVGAVAQPGASGALYARLGLVYGQAGQIDKAIEANRSAIAKSPQLLAGYQNLFVTLLQNQKPDAALKVLDDAARQVNPPAEFLVGLGDLYARFVLQLPSQKANVLPRALAVLDRARKCNSPEALLKLRLAETYQALGHGNQAAEIYLDLLKKLPDVPMLREQLHGKLAGIYLRSSDRTNAITQLQAILRDDPTNAEVYYYLGFLCYGEKRAVEAVDYFNKTILLNPDFLEAYYQLALAHLSLNQSKEALETLEKARSKSPQNFLLEFYSGLAWSSAKDYAAALRHLTAAELLAKATEPRLLDREFYFQVGACHERTGDHAQAEQYFQKCLEISPDWSEACNYLGYMWAERGVNLEKAHELIEKAVKAEPKNAAFLDSMAWVLYQQHQPGEALKYIQQAIELSEKPDPTVLDHLGDILASLNRPAEAREAWQKAVALEPNEAIQKKLNSVPAP